jgi:DNA-binding winged helix-turn-helix (wHTH) protein/tetratricopeptide (TPR) repeat protein
MSGRMPMLRFGQFEIDLDAGALHRRGEPVRLPPQAFKVLALLVRQNGSMVSRAEMRDQLWGTGTHVEFDQGLNFCIRQVREALGDNADSPQYIETLPRRGYRLLTPVASSAVEAPTKLTRLIVLPFRVLRADPETDFLAYSLPDAITCSLSGLESLNVRSSLVAARFAGPMVDEKEIGVQADVDVIVTGTLMRAGTEIRVSAQLTDVSTGSLLWSQTAQAPVGDCFQLQDDLTKHIVASLEPPLSVRDKRRLTSDVPASKQAYEYFLRGNQLSVDAKQWTVARDLYERCVAEDPRYAPAWARLGRVHHVMAKYLDTGTNEGFVLAESAFKQALALNADHPMAHKLYAQLEADLGRAQDAMVRLLGRASMADAEVMAGLVTACRYCGLLDASVGAHTRARQLDAKLKTSVPHTWYLQGDHERVVTIPVVEFPYIVPLSLAELGRGDEALPVLRELEAKNQTRLRNFIVAARTLLEGDRAESVAAVIRVVSSGFRDPEGRFYLARHLAHLGSVEPALALLQQVVADGFFCYPVIERDPWLDSLRKKPAFTKLLRSAEAQHRKASDAFERLDGRSVLAMRS